MKNFAILAISIFTTIFGFTAAEAKELILAPELEALYQILKTVPVNYKPEGIVCEQVARLQAMKTYPAERYTVTTGVSYEIGDGTVGELDLVIFETATGHVEKVAEVKCWHNFSSAMDKAKMQQDRFLWHLKQYPQKIQFSSGEGWNFNEESFRDIESFLFISQAGGTEKGFDEEIPYTLEDMASLRQKLVRCQNQRKCPLPAAFVPKEDRAAAGF